ncbi:MAG: glycosyltransferase [Clostridia bacterium]|nr:glycosyltransferase [Clostridia bacterium]
MDILRYISIAISIIFFVCYFHQLVYIPVALFGKKKKKEYELKKNDYAVLICARNEEKVIGNLIRSIRQQTYDANLIHIFVMADACTDRTAEIALSLGARVYYRNDPQNVGKGYAMQEMLRHLKEEYPEGFDGYFVFDADNLLKKDYIERMNETFCQGYDAVTSYRNSKNYGDNWLSAGIGLWFLRESVYLNGARDILGTGCAVSGTGFLFSRRIAEDLGDWPFHLLTEDVEFSVDCAIKGKKIGYCKDAEFFDEQPIRFAQSWRQRLRWSKGGFQVIGKYFKQLVKGMFTGNFACYDMAFAFMPGFVLAVLSVLVNIAIVVWGIVAGSDALFVLRSLGEMFLSMYGSMFLIGTITTITEWKRIKTTTFKKIFYNFTFPLYMITFIPIAFWAMFYTPKWKPIEHTRSIELSEDNE